VLYASVQDELMSGLAGGFAEHLIEVAGAEACCCCHLV